MRFLIPVLMVSAALVASAPSALCAQGMVQALPGTTDGDRLAEQMRALAANPRDLNALIAAADLSLSLGDLSGAASLYARAEKVSFNDPRIKAGEGAILVRSERPGEALRYFAQAEAAGYDARRFVADRGLAYDLIGQQERAQRDYRLALKTRPDDEIVRRYALSLGISGKREAALEQLDPLLRKSDRSAWRVRAFVLAMGGDQVGAEKIATTMLPQGMAQGLMPFFRRLPSLPAADRAFAVHFGEVHTSPERLADARLAPNLPLLAPEVAPVALASVQPTQPNKRDRNRRDSGRREPLKPGVALAANNARPPQPAVPSYANATSALTRVQPGGQTSGPAATLASTPTLSSVTSTATSPAASPAPTVVAAAPLPSAMPARSTVAAATPAPQLAQSRPAGSPRPVTPAAPLPVTTPPVSATAPPVQLAGTQGTASPPVLAPAAALRGQTAAPTPGFSSSSVEPIAVLPTAAPTTTLTPPPAPNFTAPPSRAEADSVLARIVAGLSIPSSELGVVQPVRLAPVTAIPTPDTAARVIAEAKAKEARDAAAEKALAAKAIADKRAADRKAVTDKKALAAKKLADEKKLADAKAAAEEKKAAAEEKKAARANPERIWVQVAGGANEGDLPKAYAAVKAKAPAAFASRSAWSTPLRATNRVLVGPFKTDAEARAFVNQLKKEGVSTFTFTSDAGQPVTRLAAGKSSR